jgi:hypothetical protein
MFIGTEKLWMVTLFFHTTIQKKEGKKGSGRLGLCRLEIYVKSQGRENALFSLLKRPSGLESRSLPLVKSRVIGDSHDQFYLLR